MSSFFTVAKIMSTSIIQFVKNECLVLKKNIDV